MGAFIGSAEGRGLVLTLGDRGLAADAAPSPVAWRPGSAASHNGQPPLLPAAGLSPGCPRRALVPPPGRPRGGNPVHEAQLQQGSRSALRGRASAASPPRRDRRPQQVDAARPRPRSRLPPTPPTPSCLRATTQTEIARSLGLFESPSASPPSSGVSLLLEGPSGRGRCWEGTRGGLF